MGVALMWSKCLLIAGSLAALCVLAYGRSLFLPFISDDYIQIELARKWGPASGWIGLAQDVLYRTRATSLITTYWIEQLFGLDPISFNLSGLILHFVNCLLVALTGFWHRIGWRISLAAAGFFAVHQAHQEAVIWHAALPELLVFACVLLSVLAWIRWLETGDWRFYASAAIAFLAALFSKESAVAVVPILALLTMIETGTFRRLLWVGPFLLTALAYFWSIYAAHDSHLHFNDGTFSLQAPVWFVLPRSVSRLLWVSGYLSLILIAVTRSWRRLPLIGLSLVWMAITFAPYSFLTYMPFVPSRHTYLASLGAAYIVAAGLWTLHERVRSRMAMASLAILLVGAQCFYLWTRKHRQYAERAAPTEALLKSVERMDANPIRLKCFPYSPLVAESAVAIRLGRQVRFVQDHGDPATPADVDFCSAADASSGN
ncbi:MAG: hypothetical protein ACKV22_06490 [Bryobacteraceae bacterium]